MLQSKSNKYYIFWVCVCNTLLLRYSFLTAINVGLNRRGLVRYRSFDRAWCFHRHSLNLKTTQTPEDGGRMLLWNISNYYQYTRHHIQNKHNFFITVFVITLNFAITHVFRKPGRGYALNNKARRCERTHTHTQYDRGSLKGGGLPGCSPPKPTKLKCKKYRFCGYYDIKSFT
jgi:hypothetical protein